MQVEAEEFRKIKPWRFWAILIAVAISTIGWGLLNYVFIQDISRGWDYGTLPDAPSESIYSSSRPGSQVDPQPQIAPLPEATPSAGTGVP